ncbi:zinc-dependent peptidase [Flavihumibacter rivuli]|uniref:zinc-dependent peptidase n=1 Tax=Flavihumibacter rivuli TaxID=2838156 RepID=UPI001BDF2898|nr:zinc-dependent peptidase [Flavihumibacter rivuli]ULQ56614.1 zinc-dependent peptidase [Flavihumibacter rivuli]
MEIVFICLLVFCTIYVFDALHHRFHRYLLFRRRKGFEQHETYFRSIISQNIRYFNRVDLETQQKWLFRAYLFYRAKKFHYVGVSKSDEMPILISATAAQLTLGLENFSLNYFRDIYVLEHDYHYGYYSLPFMGHVDHSGIYLSWDNFLQGLRTPHDSSNVGLHEMAHALAYVNFVTRTDEDKHFKKEFRNFSAVARPVFQDMQRGVKTLLGDYAATNYHEFWAVAVEVFFENPIRFQRELPDLYAAMVRLLRQDPYLVITKSLVA